MVYMNTNESENFDNKSENFVLQSIFLNEKIQNKLLEIYDFIDKKEIIRFAWEDNFISNFYKKLGFIEESFLWNSQKQEIILMFFGNQFDSKQNFIEKLLHYSKNIEAFRALDIEQKWFIMYFIELIIEDKINIHDNYYTLLQETSTDKWYLIDLSHTLILEWLEIFKQEIMTLLNSYNNFFDKYGSFDNNYLSTQELEWFKSHFLDVFHNLFTYIVFQDEIISKIKEIESRIENNIILN